MPGLGILVLFLACLVIFIIVLVLVAKTKAHAEDDDSNFADKLSNLFVLFIGYAQILSSITETCSNSTSWGDSFPRFSQSFGIVNLDLSSVFPSLSCNLNFKFRTQMLLHFATPIAMVVTIKLAEIAATAWTRMKKQQSKASRQAQSAYVFKIRMTILLLVYPVGIASFGGRGAPYSIQQKASKMNRPQTTHASVFLPPFPSHIPFHTPRHPSPSSTVAHQARIFCVSLR